MESLTVLNSRRSRCHYTFVNGRLSEVSYKPVYIDHYGRISSTYGRRRYINRPASADIPYTPYGLSSPDYTGSTLNGYASSLDPHTYEIMSKYTQGYDYPQSSDSTLRSYHCASSSGIGSSSSYGQSDSHQPSHRPYRQSSYGSHYDLGTSHGVSSGSYGSSVLSCDNVGSSYGDSGRFSSRYGEPENRKSVDSNSNRTVRPPHERYKPLVDETPTSYPRRSRDVDLQNIRSRKYRRDENKNEPKSETTQIKGAYELYKENHKHGKQCDSVVDSFDLERPVFSSVEESSDSFKPYSFDGRSQHVKKRERSQERDPVYKSRGSSGEEKLDRPHFDSVGRENFEKTASMETQPLSAWRRRRMEREQREKEKTLDKAKKESSNERSDNKTQDYVSVESVDKISVHNRTTAVSHEQDVRKDVEKSQRPKSVDPDTIRNLLLTSDSPLLRSRYREAVRKREQLSRDDSLDTVSDISQESVATKSQDSAKSEDWKSAKALHESLRRKDKQDPDKKIEKLYQDTAEINIRKNLSPKSTVENLKESVSVKKNEGNFAKEAQVKEKERQDNVEQNRQEPKKRILVSSRSKIENLRDSVRQQSESVAENLQFQNVPNVSVSSTESKSIRSDNMPYSRKRLTSSDLRESKEQSMNTEENLSKFYSKNDEEKVQTNVSISKEKILEGNVKTTTSQKDLERVPSKRSMRLDRAQHHGQQGPSIVKHMSDLLFEDPKSIRSERKHAENSIGKSTEKDAKDEKRIDLKERSSVFSKQSTYLSNKINDEKETSTPCETQSFSYKDKVKSKDDTNQVIKLSANEKEKTSSNAQLSSVKTDQNKDFRSVNTKSTPSSYTSDTIGMSAESADKQKSKFLYGKAKTTDISSILTKTQNFNNESGINKSSEIEKNDSVITKVADSRTTLSQKENVSKTRNVVRNPSQKDAVTKQEESKVVDKLETTPLDKDNSDVGVFSNLSSDVGQMSRAERIARYKEERKRQLAYIATKFNELGQNGSGKEVVPSLFTSAREKSEEREDSSLARSKSMREGSPQKYLSPVLRSKSLREDLSPKKTVEQINETEESASVPRAPLKSSVKSIDETGKEVPLTQKIAANRLLFEKKDSDDEGVKKLHRKSLIEGPIDEGSRRSSSSSDHKSLGDESALEKLKQRYLFGADFSETKSKAVIKQDEVQDKKELISISSDDVHSTSISSEDTSQSEVFSVNIDKVKQTFSKQHSKEKFLFGTQFTTSKESKGLSKENKQENVSGSSIPSDKEQNDSKSISVAADSDKMSKKRRRLPSIPLDGSSDETVSNKTLSESESDLSQNKKKPALPLAHSSSSSMEPNIVHSKIFGQDSHHKPAKSFTSSDQIHKDSTIHPKKQKNNTAHPTKHEQTDRNQIHHYGDKEKSNAFTKTNQSPNEIKSKPIAIDKSSLDTVVPKILETKKTVCQNELKSDSDVVIQADNTYQKNFIERNQSQKISDINTDGTGISGKSLGKSQKPIQSAIYSETNKTHKGKSGVSSDNEIKKTNLDSKIEPINIQKSTKLRRRSPVRSRIPLSPSKKQEPESGNTQVQSSSKAISQSSAICSSQDTPDTVLLESKQQITPSTKQGDQIVPNITPVISITAKDSISESGKMPEQTLPHEHKDILQHSKSIPSSTEKDLFKSDSNQKQDSFKVKSEVANVTTKSEISPVTSLSNTESNKLSKKSDLLKSSKHHKHDIETQKKTDHASKSELLHAKHTHKSVPKLETVRKYENKLDDVKHKTKVETAQLSKLKNGNEQILIAKPEKMSNIETKAEEQTLKTESEQTSTVETNLDEQKLEGKSEMVTRSEAKVAGLGKTKVETLLTPEMKFEEIQNLETKPDTVAQFVATSVSKPQDRQVVEINPEIRQTGHASGSTENRRKSYSSDEGSKTGRKRSFKLKHHSKSVSDKGLKVNLQRSKTITEKELKLSESHKSDKQPSNEEIRKILSKSPETNLDDLLLENVDYLSDIETMDPWGLHKNEPANVREGLQARSKKLHLKHSGSLAHSTKAEDTENRSNNREMKASTADMQDTSTPLQITDTKAVLSIDEKQTSQQQISKAIVLSQGDKMEGDHDTTEQRKLGSGPGQDKSDFEQTSELVLREGISEKSQDLSSKGISDITVDKTSIVSKTTEIEKKRRKDKSSVRKSVLNAGPGEEGDIGQRGLDKRKDDLDLKTCETSATPENLSNHISKHSVTNNSVKSHHHDNRTEHAPSSRSTLLESILPSKFSIPSKVSSVINRFSSEKGGKKIDSETNKTDNSTKSPRRIARRKNDFSSLLQKFSGSDQSSSEADISPRRRINLCRQEAYSLSSDDSESRRTPERTQSLRVKKSKESFEGKKGVQRSESFKSDFMRSRYSPETVTDIPLIEDKEEMATPNPELAAILNRRHKVVTEQQIEGQEQEKEQIYSKNIEKEGQIHSSSTVEQVISDSEVASALKARLQETSTEKRFHDQFEGRVPISTKENDIIIDSEVANVLKARKKETDSNTLLDSDEKLVKENATSCHSLETDSVIPKEVNEEVLKSGKTHESHDTSGSGGRQQHEKICSKIQNSAKPENMTQSTISQIVDTDQNISERSKIPHVESHTCKKLSEAEQEIKDLTAPTPAPHVVTKIKSEKEKVSEKLKSPERTFHSTNSLSKEKLLSPSPERVQTKSSSIRRTESCGTKDVERPKGILKRSKSVKSQVIVDAELASILQKRRQEQDGEEEEEAEDSISNVSKDIEETHRREKEHSCSSQDFDDETPKLSIQERIFHMQNRLEETKSCPITPKSKSGTVTPKLSFKGRAGSVTPKAQASFEDHSPSPVSGEQLIEKLSSLAERGHKFTDLSEKRKSFQKRSRDDWRTRTQPVTLEEIQEADGLESVVAFRREVLKKASSNVFEQIEKQDKLPILGKKSEYPHHLPREKLRRSRKERHKTLPITAAELNAIPEGESIGIAGLRKKSDWSGARDSKADSGILSGSSDIENCLDSVECHASVESLRSLSLEMDMNDDDPARLSVSAKASIFTNIVEKEKSKIEKPKSSASGAKRYIDRKKRERCQTQPVTEDEVKSAAEIADNTDTSQSQIKSEPAEDEKTDDAARRSLAEKVKLFSSLKEAEKPAQKPDPPVVRRRNRKQLTSRFNTQPVTIEEVEKAAKFRISPLAMSMVKPPDPELMKGLSLSAQRELMAQHAEKVMSQPSSRSNSRHSSTVDLSDKSQSSTDLSKDKEVKTSKDVTEKQILNKNMSKSESDMKGILRSDSGKISDEPKSILKHHDVETHEELKRLVLEKDGEHKGILKSHSVSSEIVEQKSILRTMPHTDDEDEFKSELQEKIVKGVLKLSGVEDSLSDSEPKGILKKESSYQGKKMEPEKGVLKESSFEKAKDEPEKSVLKESSFEVSKSEPEKGVLKHSCPKVKEDISVSSTLKHELEDKIASDLIEDVQQSDKKSPSPERKSTSGGCISSIRRRRRDPKQPERYLTQPNETTSPEKSPEGSPRLRYGATRHKTQPITPEEKKEAEGSPTGRISVKDRLGQLKKSGEEDWKKRVSRPTDLNGTQSEVKLREKKSVDLPRPSSIADRLNLLETSQGGWKGRVGEKDAQKFTVAHKLAGQVEESPLMKKLREKSNKKDSESESGSPDIMSPSTPSRDWPKIPLPKTIISGPPVAEDAPEIKKTTESRTIVFDQKEDAPPVKVAVPSMDDEHLKSFFMSRESTEITSEKLDVSVEDFNELFIVANDMLPSTRKVRPKRKHRASVMNPLKTTSVEIKTEYEEVSFGYIEKEMRRIQTEKVKKDAGFAEAALAGLASKENFASVSLRKTTETAASKVSSRLDPYKDVMLIHVKGRRRVQVRLVEPCAKSMNSGDCYLLVTPDKIIHWIGEFSNVIEKAKAADIASFICQKRDMGCKASVVETVEEKKQHLGAGKKFWSTIGGLQTISSAGPPEEDELYENHVVASNMVYRLENNSLVPYQEYWGMQPKHEMLKKDQVLVFDFGTELYVWQGKAVKPDKRKMSVKLARQLYEKGYDYSACDINPMSPMSTEDMGGLPLSAKERPPWTLFGKVNQNMETILFREKFADWPDTSRLIKVKSMEEISGSKTDLTELKPVDATLMLPVNTKPVSLVLEGSNVGRGVSWAEDMEGFIREQDIVTLGVTVWHVMEYEHYKLPEASYGQFHDEDTYVVRWQYMITNKGMKDLKGTQSRRSLVGRERCAYFFWQGKSSTINEKGASALMTVELDEERGPQVRVDEGKEMPCFLNLFKGKMITHIGKREDESTNTQGAWRCYCVRGQYENELNLMEIPVGVERLRSRTSLLILNVKSGLLYLWHGSKSPPHCRKLTKLAADRLKENCPLEVGVSEGNYILITEMEEGSEKAEFWSFLGVETNSRSLYSSLISSSMPYDYTLRVFHMTSASGSFEVQEILNPFRTPDLISPFPVLQSDLYKASQPGLFLVDDNNIVYLWHGWWPEADSEVENILTGSAKARFNIDRKCAIDTAIHYCQVKNSENPPIAVAVYAGLEPLKFTNLFPYWDVDESAKTLNLRDGKKEGEMTPLQEILDKVTQTRYTYEELTEEELPDGVDPQRLESYLDDEEFEEIMEISREEFNSLPQWKQAKIKQQVGLF